MKLIRPREGFVAVFFLTLFFFATDLRLVADRRLGSDLAFFFVRMGPSLGVSRIAEGDR
jgi:hypothetical protein